MIPRYITIHDTANTDRGADAAAHAQYLRTTSATVSWHYTVDDGCIIQHLPLDEVGWHAGDGSKGTGNRASIGIEICENADGDRVKAEERAARLVAFLLRTFGLGIDAVVQHHRWTGKNCPRLLRPRWSAFIQQIQSHLGGGDMQMPVLTRGATGQAVRTLQERLNVHGWSLAVDGSFGPATESAVRAFQAAKGLVVDGSVGPATWAELMREPEADDYRVLYEAEKALRESFEQRINAIRKAGGW